MLDNILKTATAVAAKTTARRLAFAADQNLISCEGVVRVCQGGRAIETAH